MASLVLSVAGAAIGFAVGGPAGAQIGFSLGGAAAGLLFPPKGPDGPRLSDLTIQGSAYGASIPLVYGSVRLTGNVIWAAKIVEHSQQQGGKGGPTSTTYSYTDSFAVSICEGPIGGISRMWADGLLIYDITPTHTGESIGFKAGSFKVYTGSETQLADPTIQSLIGSTPAYRGQAYVVFTDLQLAKYGNRIPSLSFEVINQPVTTLSLPAQLLGKGSDVAYNPVTNTFWTAYNLAGSGANNFILDVYNATTFAKVGTTILGVGGSDLIHLVYAAGFMYVSRDGNPTVSQAVITKLDAVSRQIVEQSSTDYVPAGSSLGAVLSNGVQLSLSAVNVAAATYEIVDSLDSSFGNLIPGRSQSRTNSVNAVVYCTGSARSCYAGFFATNAPNWLDIQSDINTASISVTNPAWTGAHIGHRLIEIPGSPFVLWTMPRQFSVAKVHTLTGVVTTAITVDSTAYPGGIKAMHYSKDTNRVYIDTHNLAGDTTTAAALAYDLATGTLLAAYTQSSYAGGSLQGRSVYLGNETFAACESTSSPSSLLWIAKFSMVSIGQGQPAALAAIVSDLSVRAGLLTSDIDVTALTDFVQGYTVSHQLAARSALEPLMQAFFFDPVDSDYLIKYKKRGGQPAFTILDADLAAHVAGGGSPKLIQVRRKQELDIPQSVSVKYINPSADYQVSTQYGARQTTRSSSSITVDFPIVMSDAKAKQIADAALYSAWTERTGISFATSIAYAAMEPTDTVIVHGRLVRVVHRKRNGGVMEWEGYADGNTSYANDTLTQQGASGVAGVTQQTIVKTPLTRVSLLDLALLIDSDAAPGFYIAAQGVSIGWTGAQLWKSIDGGASYLPIISVPNTSIFGTVQGVLPAFFGGDTFDELNSVTVILPASSDIPTLSSASELNVLNGANVALVGSEILQYRNAVLNGDGSYTLSGLLRYRKGTESVVHSKFESFVALTANIVRLSISSAEIGLLRYYKAVSNGGSLADAIPVQFTYKGRDLLPYSPVLIAAGREVDGSVDMFWTRRTRIGGEWRDAVDVPLSEASEKYDVEIYNATYTTLIRTFFGVATSAQVYTLAQQTADFGGAQSAVYVKIYQLSDAIGRGIPGVATV